MSDLTFGVKLTADGKQLTGEVKASRAEFDALNTSVQRVSSTAALLNITQGELASRLKANADYTAAYKARVEEVRTAHERAAEQIYVVNDSYLKAAGGAEKSMLATQGARRELMVLGHEAMNGNFSRMPGSFMVLAERMNLTAALFNPLTIGAVALGVTAIGLGVAFAKGREEMNAMNNALAVTSNYAGLTRGGMESLASSMAASGQISIGTSKDIVTALVASGRIGADAIGTVARLTSDFARATGQDISKIAPEMVKLFADPLKGAEELNKSMHFLTAADMEHIATLEQLGRTQEAQLFLAQKVSDHLPKEAENIGIAAKAWRGLKDAISGTADALMGIGKTSTVEDELTRKAAQLADQWMRTGRFNISTQNEYNALLAQSSAQQEKTNASSAAAKKITDENEIAALAKQNSELWKKYEINRKIARLTGTSAPEAPSMDAVQQDAAYQLQKKNDGKVSNKDANAAYRAEIAAQEAFQRERADLFKRTDADQKRMLDAGEMSQADYIGAMNTLRGADLLGQIESYRKEEAAAKANKNNTDAIRYGGEAAKAREQLDALESQKQEELKVLARKQLDAAAGVTRPLTTDYRKTDEARARAAEFDLMGASQQRLAQALDAVNDRARAAREALDVKFPQRERESAAYTEALAKINEAEKAAGQSAREWAARQDELNASWEHGADRALRSYLDQVKNVSAQTEQAFSKGFKSMEDAVTQFAMTGKLSIRSFAQTCLEEFYRINVSRPLVSAGAGLLQSALGAIGGYFGGGSAAPSPAVTQPGGGMINIPGRAVGGPVDANSLYRVNEVVPEVFSTGGNDYLMTGGRGGVVTPLTPAKSSSGTGSGQSQATTLVYSPNIQIDARNATPGMEQTIARVVNQAVEQTRIALMAELGAGGQFALATGRRK